MDSLEKLCDELRRSGQLTKENLSQFQRRFGPSMMNELDKLKEQARFMEQKVENAVMRGSSLQHMTLSGASSLPAGKLFTVMCYFSKPRQHMTYSLLNAEQSCSHNNSMNHCLYFAWF